MSKIKFGQMIDYLRVSNGMSMEDFGNLFGKNKSTISRWIKGTRFPTIPEAEAIAEYFEIPFDVLIFGASESEELFEIHMELEENRRSKVLVYAKYQLEEQKRNKVNENVIELEQYINVQSSLSAGTGIIDLDPEYTDEVLYTGFVPKHDLAFRVSGNSMEPVFEDGEIIFVEKTPDIHNGQFIAVEINDEAYIKKAYLENEQLRLVSLNKDYDDILANGNDEIRVVGRVIL